MLDLCGDWSLSDDSGAYQAVLRLPGDGIDALFRAADAHQLDEVRAAPLRRHFAASCHDCTPAA